MGKKFIWCRPNAKAKSRLDIVVAREEWLDLEW